MKRSIGMRRREFLVRSAAAGRGRNVMQKHVQNFLDCCRLRKQPNALAEVGHSGVCGPHLANVAFLNQTRARMNADATKVYL